MNRWTVTEAQRHLRVSRRTVYAMCRRGDLRFELFHGRITIEPIEIEQVVMTVRSMADSMMYSPRHVRRLLQRTRRGIKTGSSRNSHYRVSLSDAAGLMASRFGIPLDK